MKHLFSLVALAGLLVPASHGANPTVEIKTSKGTIKAELFEDKAPITVKNFLKNVEAKHYDGTIFHRVIPTFMIQGGGYTKGFSDVVDEEGVRSKERKTGAAIMNEADNGLKNLRGTLAMARTPEPHSATAQFFINVKDNPFLDHTSKDREGWGYAVFGKVVEGMDVVDKIKAVKTKVILRGAMKDVPAEEVVIESIKVVK